MLQSLPSTLESLLEELELLLAESLLYLLEATPGCGPTEATFEG